MSHPYTANLTLVRGADFSFTYRILDVNHDPVDLLTGSSAFAAQIRESNRRPLAASFTITPQTGDDAGDLLFELSEADTSALDPRRRYQWDFFWTDSGGTVRCMLRGSVTVFPNITHL